MAADDNRLQKAPLGVLGALSLKVGGRNPTRFSDTLQPQIDVYDQYLAREMTEDRQIGAIAIGARTASAQHVAPSGFAWRVLAISAAFSVDVADIALTATAITSVTSPAVAGTTVQPQGDMVINGATGLFRSLGHWLERPFFLPPGWNITQRVLLSANVTVAISTVNFCLIVQPIEL